MRCAGLYYWLMKGQNLTLPAFALGLVLGIASAAAQARAVTAAGTKPAEAPARYCFPDAMCITGGRFGEGGEDRLLFMDTEGVQRGGLFKKQEDGYVSMLGDGTHLRFEEGGARLIWIAADGSCESAHRVHLPVAREVRFDGAEGARLAGTLYLPRPPNPDDRWPAVILAHGSGAVDRHAGPWIAFFTARDIAVLSYDKRGVGASEGAWRDAPFTTLAADLEAAVAFATTQPGIDPQRVGIHSTSQSGWYAPHSIVNGAQAAFLIQRAGPAVRAGVGTLHERTREWQSDGVPADAIAAAGAFWSAIHALAEQGGSLSQAQDMLDAVRSEPWFESTYGEWSQVRQEWWGATVANQALDPAVDASKLSIPVLWFLATDDENVPYEQSRTALAAAGANVTIVAVQGARHDFLVRDADGNLRYTTAYWSGMSRWLERNGMCPRCPVVEARTASD